MDWGIGLMKINVFNIFSIIIFFPYIEKHKVLEPLKGYHFLMNENDADTAIGYFEQAERFGNPDLG